MPSRRFVKPGTRWSSMDSFYAQGGRDDIPVGEFGCIRQWSCEECGPLDDEPGYRVTHRQTMECPEEGVNECPDCGGLDICNRDDPRWYFLPVAWSTIYLKFPSNRQFTNLTGAQRGNPVQIKH